MTEAKEKKKDNRWKDIIKKYGKVISDGHNLIEQPQTVIPISPRLNIALNGGVPSGSWFVITGPPKLGKSLTALSFCSQAQKSEYGGREVFYLNVEHRLRKRDIQGVLGLNLDKFHIIGSSKGHILTATQYLELAEEIIHTNPSSVVVIDSFSALATESELTGPMDKALMGETQRIIARFCRKMASVVPVQDVTLVGITHLYSNLSGWGSQYKEKSGNALLYQSDVKLFGKKFKRIDDRNGHPFRQQITWRVDFSPLGSPGIETTSTLTFNKGVDWDIEIADLAVDLGIILKQGAYFQYKDKKFHGMEQVYQHVIENELYKELNKEIQEMLS